MKKLILLTLTLVIAFCMTGCAGQKEDIEDKEKDENSTVLSEPESSVNAMDGYYDDDVPNQVETVPTPPAAKDFLPGLWQKYECTELSVNVNGVQAEYIITAYKDGRLVNSVGSYSLILEYDILSGEWKEIHSDWDGWKHTFDSDGFEENHTWFIKPKPGSDGVYIRFSNVTSSGCYVSWESMDDDLTVNGTQSGYAYCTFELGGINGNENSPCWVLNDLTIDFDWNYYGGKYKTCTYYVQIRNDEICAPFEDPFSSTTEDATVLRYNG